MAETAGSVDRNLPDNVQAPLGNELQPRMELREDLIDTAVKFLQNPKVRQSPLAQRKAFLEKKGLTKAEIELAVYRSGTAGDEQAVLPVKSIYQDNSSTQNLQNSDVARIAPSGWTRVKDSASLAVIIGAAFYAAYQLYDKYLAPRLYGKKSSSADELTKNLEELRRNLAELSTSISETQQLMRNQQRALDDIVRATSLQRGPEEIGRFGIAEVKDEIRSLKGLLLHKNQFPPLPTTTPVIPSWQLQQKQLDNSSKSVETADVVDASRDSKINTEKDESAGVHSGIDDKQQPTFASGDDVTNDEDGKTATSNSVDDGSAASVLENGTASDSDDQLTVK